MSDAHDSVQEVKDALRIFSKRGVDRILFTGDMIGSGNCCTFEKTELSDQADHRNNDDDRADLAREFDRVGGEPRARASDLPSLRRRRSVIINLLQDLSYFYL
jgi:predicted phosphodiesterase